jgi:hypothetical protein
MTSPARPTNQIAKDYQAALECVGRGKTIDQDQAFRLSKAVLALKDDIAEFAKAKPTDTGWNQTLTKAKSLHDFTWTRPNEKIQSSETGEISFKEFSRTELLDVRGKITEIGESLEKLGVLPRTTYGTADL